MTTFYPKTILFSFFYMFWGVQTPDLAFGEPTTALNVKPKGTTRNIWPVLGVPPPKRDPPVWRDLKFLKK